MATDIEARFPVMDITTRGPTATHSTVHQLVDRYLGDLQGAISPLSAGTGGESWRRRGPEVFKKAYYKAERDMRDRESRFEEEKRASHSKIHQLRAIEAREKPVVVLIDGDGAIFLPSFAGTTQPLA